MAGNARLGLLGLVTLLSVLPVLASASGGERPPNVVFILGDDHGYPYAGFMGSEIVETPHLDRLAEEGTVFTHAFSSASVCRPALQTLSAGLHTRSWALQRARTLEAIGEWIPHRAEVQHYATLARQLARQGYTSFQGGKHWEGDFQMAGFDAGTATHLPVNPFLQVGQATFARPSLSPMDEFLDEVDEDEPFLLFLAPMLPHVPLDPPADLISRYTGRGFVNPAVLYYANITRLDAVVGQIIQRLEARGLRDDSLIIYVSDNGWEQAPDRSHFLGNVFGGDRGKMSIYEIGFRTPLVFNWPGHVPEGRVLDDLVQFEDLHATILGDAGAPIPPDHDGFDLGPRIDGSGEEARDVVIGVQDYLRVRQEEWVPGSGLARIEEASFLRTDEWRYIEWVDRGEQALYRIEEDPSERNDVSADHPELLEALAAEARAWRNALTIPASWMDLMGRLTSEDGAPAAGLRLWLETFDDAEPGATWETFSDDRGYFRFPNVPAGEFSLSYEIEAASIANRRRHGRPESETESQVVDLTNYQTAPFLRIQIPGEARATPLDLARPGTLEIELVARGDAETRALPVHVVGWTRRGLIEQRALSGPDGFVALDQLPAGVYFVRASGSGGAHVPTRWAHLRPGETRLLQLDVREPRGWRAKRGNSHHAP